VAGGWLAEAERALREARKDRFLRNHAASTARLEEAVGHLRRAVGEARGMAEEERKALAAALSGVRRELRLAEATQGQAEGFLGQWGQAIVSAAGREAGYTREGVVAATTEPVRIAVEG
jgi:ABC-type transporter Mla subunit MlaD